MNLKLLLTFDGHMTHPPLGWPVSPTSPLASSIATLGFSLLPLHLQQQQYTQIILLRSLRPVASTVIV